MFLGGAERSEEEGKQRTAGISKIQEDAGEADQLPGEGEQSDGKFGNQREGNCGTEEGEYRKGSRKLGAQTKDGSHDIW